MGTPGKMLGGESEPVALITTREQDGIKIYTLSGEFGYDTRQHFRQKLIGHATRDVASKVVLDLTEVKYIDTFFLGILVSVVKRVHPYGGIIALVITDPDINRVLTITGLDRIFEIYSSVDRALERRLVY